MKIVKILIALVFMSSISVWGYAQITNQPSTDRGKLIQVKSPTKHRAPSNVFIEYAYTGNGFYFMPSGIFETLSVTVTNAYSSESWSGSLSESDGYILETGTLPAGAYSILAVTESGVEFSGDFCIESN